jgi:DNA-binding IclR family transcriptional regulator
MTEVGEPRIKSSRTTVEILIGLQELDGAGVSELANHVGVSKTTAYNHLSTLREMDFVVKAEDNTYHLGLKLLEIAHGVKRRFDYSNLIEQEVDKIAEVTGEMALFAVPEGMKNYMFYLARGDQAIQTDFYEGYSSSLHSTAVGKAILAHLQEEVREKYISETGLAKFTEETITSPESLQKELEEIRRSGVAYNQQEHIHGLSAVAAPVIRQDGVVVGALSITGPTNRISEEALNQRFPDLVRESANIIELNITSPK